MKDHLCACVCVACVSCVTRQKLEKRHADERVCAPERYVRRSDADYVYQLSDGLPDEEKLSYARALFFFLHDDAPIARAFGVKEIYSFLE